jgi:hypothetical protein
MGVGEDVPAGDFIWLPAGASEEILKHTRITFDSTSRFGAAMFFGQEGIEGLLPIG